MNRKSPTLIRKATLTDLEELISLINEHADFEKTSIDLTGLDIKLKHAMQGENPRLCVFVAEINSRLQGYCSLTEEFSTWRGRDYIHVDCLYIKASMRGQNIGTLIFNIITEYASKRSVEEIEWQTPDWNINAQCFYDSVGAVLSGKRRYLYSLA